MGKFPKQIRVNERVDGVRVPCQPRLRQKRTGGWQGKELRPYFIITIIMHGLPALPGDIIKARMRGGALYLPLKGMSLPIFFSVLEKKRRTEGTTDGREATANDVRYFGDLAEASLGR